MGVHLMGRYLMGRHLMAVYLMGRYLIGVACSGTAGFSSSFSIAQSNETVLQTQKVSLTAQVLSLSKAAQEMPR